ncbi:MAG TPA: sugar ABC transporter permease [Nocardioidaceae bacterium]|nr:sugar ABC transporter permease [Nocardioidaceae bacterium]
MAKTEAPPPVAPSKTKTKGRAYKSPMEDGNRLAALLLSPTMLVLAAVIGYPILAAIRDSLYTQGGIDESGFVVEGDQFVGLDNYIAAFTGESADVFFNSLYVTTFFTVVSVAIEVVIGVSMALIMNRALKGRSLIRASILIPWAIPTAVSALLWRWIFDANGIANTIINQQVLWSTDGIQAQLAVIIADTWKTAPFIGLLVLAGLQVIPEEVYEAAKLDGVSASKQFWHITLPLVKPALLVAVLFRILDNLRMFDLPWVLIGRGKPSVETLSILAFVQSDQSRFGPAAAYAVLLFLYVVIVAYAFVKLLGADVIGERADKKKKSRPAGRRRPKVGRSVARGDMA